MAKLWRDDRVKEWLKIWWLLLVVKHRTLGVYVLWTRLLAENLKSWGSSAWLVVDKQGSDAYQRMWRLSWRNGVWHNLRQPWLMTREHWMIHRVPSFLVVVWFGSSPMPYPLSPDSKLSLFLSLLVYRFEKASPSINHSLLSATMDDVRCMADFPSWEKISKLGMWRLKGQQWEMCF